MDAGGVLDRLEELTSHLDDVPAWQSVDSEARDVVARLFRLAQRIQAAYLQRLADLDGRPDAVPGAGAGTVGRTFAVHALRRTAGQAARDVRAGRALAGDPALGGLPRLGAAFAAGLASREHIDAAVSAIGGVPQHLLAEPSVRDGFASGGDLLDSVLTEQASRYDSVVLQRLAQHLLDVADPDGSRSFDPDAAGRRGLTLTRDRAGMTVLRGELDSTGGAMLQAVIDHFSKPSPVADATGADGMLVKVRDQRTASQRRADALITIAKIAASSAEAGTGKGGEPPRITVITTAEELAAARAGRRTPASQSDLARLSCDSVMQRVLLAESGAVLDLGRDVRTVTPAQRRALNARDQGCVIPGCGAPAHWCEGHHVIWWRHGGRTDIGNLALVCGRHHDAIHAGIWTLEMRDGVPWVKPPGWLDSKQRLIRKAYAADVQKMRRLGRQLRLDFTDPP